MKLSIKVGMADFKVCKVPNTLKTLGLGSCVGVVLYDRVKHIGGMAHIMLPDSSRLKQDGNRMKFADTAIPDMLDEMVKLGALRMRITAKIAGGAAMFSYGTADTDIIHVGDKNLMATRNVLESLDIPIVAEDTGSNYGRTIVFNPETGDLFVRTAGKTEVII